MNPLWRDRLFATIASLLAVWLAFSIAEGATALPLLAATIALGLIVVRLTGASLDTVALGVLLIGYIVGNRGFAQFMAIPGLPLLPAEAGLALAGICLLWRSARNRTLPWRKDTLNYLLLAWMVIGTARFAYDFPRYGFVALRDYAMVYYVSFFFVAQELCRDEHRRRILIRALVVAAAALPFVFALFQVFPEFFLSTLTLRGIPFVYFKGDLLFAFFAVGGIMLFLASPTRHQVWARPLATGMVLWVFTGDNRASMIGTIVALAWLARSRFRRFAFIQLSVLAFAALVLIGLAGVVELPWATQKVRGLADRAMSVVDFSGDFSYRYEEGLTKSDNNQFRWVWWRSVATETVYENPVLGLGFGYDLARGFLQEYNPDIAEDFTARSPHNIFVTTFGRMGFAGLLILAWAFVVLLVQTRRVIRDPASDATRVALWVALWPLAVSSMLGVVLEGPMGAVVFWTVLGLANATAASSDDSASTDSSAALDTTLPADSADTPRELAPR